MSERLWWEVVLRIKPLRLGWGRDVWHTFHLEACDKWEAKRLAILSHLQMYPAMDPERVKVESVDHYEPSKTEVAPLLLEWKAQEGKR